MSIAAIRSVLKEAYNDGNFGRRICEFQDSTGKKSLQVLSKEDLASVKGSCRVLTLEQVIQMTENTIRFSQEEDPHGALKTFIQTTRLDNMAPADAMVKINAKIAEVEPLQEVAAIVNVMYAHANSKHKEEKTQGIWGRIKSYFWFRFVECRLTALVTVINQDADDSTTSLKRAAWSTLDELSRSELKEAVAKKSKRYEQRSQALGALSKEYNLPPSFTSSQAAV